ncbi:MAG: transpeptidase family protein [Flavobacteriales bacterium]|nr:transpeptidase family protein [Flavobacteriales bacterium]
MAFIAFALLAFAIFGKILWIQFAQADQWAQHAQSIEQRTQDIEPTRGQIYSTDGSLLATSVPVYNLYWDSKATGIDSITFVTELDSLCLQLSEKFQDRTPSDYRMDLLEARRLGKRYYRVVKKMSYTDMKELKTFSFIKRGRHRSGFIFERIDIRKKPFGELASRTIGIDRLGSRVGLELAYNEELAGKTGKQLMERIAGNVWKPATDEYIEAPVDGVDIISSIDVHLQDVASNELNNLLRKHNAEWGTVILMEVETGYIRAIANLTRNQDEEGYSETYNYGIGQSIETGSTFKLASLISLLEDNHVDLTDSVDTGDGVVYFYDEPMSDSHEDGYGKISVEQVFEKSSNVGTAILVDRYYKDQPQKFLDHLTAMGLRQPLGIRLKGEKNPFIYEKVREGNWSGLSLTQMSIGYEVQQTPLQTLAFYNAIANGGTLMRPQFVESLTRNGKTIETNDPIVLQERICSRSTLKKTWQMMQGVCEEGGTADYIFKDSPYRVAGKTGTAKIAYSGGYYKNRYRASFVGFFPAENPKYSCIVVVNDPRSGVYYGSAIAAPVFKGLADKIYATQLELHDNQEPELLLGDQSKLPVSRSGAREDLERVFAGLAIPTSDNNESPWIETSTKEDHVALGAREQARGLIPNVVGMGLQDALYLLENAGLQVEVSGYGTVKRQSVPAGAAIRNHRRIRIELS